MTQKGDVTHEEVEHTKPEDVEGNTHVSVVVEPVEHLDAETGIVTTKYSEQITIETQSFHSKIKAIHPMLHTFLDSNSSNRYLKSGQPSFNIMDDMIEKQIVNIHFLQMQVVRPR